MAKKIPWDVWVAGYIAGAALLAEIFDSGAAIFILIYFALCAHIAAQTVGSELDGG